MTDYQKLNDLKQRYIKAENLEAVEFLEKKILAQFLATEFGQGSVASEQTVDQEIKTEKPVPVRPTKKVTETPRISQEEYIEYLANLELDISDETWEWFHEDHHCTIKEAAEFLDDETHNVRRQAGDKIKGFQTKPNSPWILYRGSVVCAKLEIPDAT